MKRKRENTHFNDNFNKQFKTKPVLQIKLFSKGSDRSRIVD